MSNKSTLKQWAGPTEFLKLELPNVLGGYVGVRLGESHRSNLFYAATRNVRNQIMSIDDLTNSIGLEVILHPSVTAVTDNYLAGLLLDQIYDFNDSSLLKKMVRFVHPDKEVVTRAERSLLMAYLQYNKNPITRGISKVRLHLASLK